jgi:hypothetical protein
VISFSFFVIAYRFYNTIKERFSQGSERSKMRTAHKIQKYFLKFTKTSESTDGSGSSSASATSLPGVSWTRPPLNLVKVNFDASFIENTKTGAWGFVARDDTGEFFAAATGKLRHISSALQAETEACAAAIEGAAALLGLHRIVFESDC